MVLKPVKKNIFIRQNKVPRKHYNVYGWH